MIEKLKQNKLTLIIFIIAILLIITGVTYSFYKIKLEGQKTHFVSSDLISFTYKESENKISITNMTPVSDTDGKKSNNFEFSVSSNLVKDMSVDYEISILKTSTTNSFNESDIKAYLTDENDNSLVEPVIISELEDNSKITNAKTIYQNNFTYNNSNEKQTHTYRLRIWLKDNVDLSKYTTKTETENGTNVTLENHTFKFKVNVNTYEKVNLDTSGANAPVLASNMIPVYYDETNETWKKADISNMNRINQWYSYAPTGKHKGMWANAVTVKDTNRQTYLNASPGTTISMDDITTMWVWIPRFNAVTPSNYNGGTKEAPNAIDVTFVKQNETAIDAFTFGDKELSGFWYAKFETSHSTLTSKNSLGCTNETCSNANGIIIKPNVSSLKFQTLDSFFYASRSMEQSGNSFGFVSTEVDTHMSKNNEWGAVAYLAQSIYGRCTDSTTCTEVYINNSSGYYTGRSGGAAAGSTPINETYTDQTSTTKYNTYGFYTYDDYLLNYDTNTEGSKVQGKGTGASTTGTIYGVYDMSGGATEYVMGLLDNTIFQGNIDEKYYNYYTSISYEGHALAETNGFYKDGTGKFGGGGGHIIRNLGAKGDQESEGIFAFLNCTYFSSSTLTFMGADFSSRFVITNE